MKRKLYYCFRFFPCPSAFLLAGFRSRKYFCRSAPVFASLYEFASIVSTWMKLNGMTMIARVRGCLCEFPFLQSVPVYLVRRDFHWKFQIDRIPSVWQSVWWSTDCIYISGIIDQFVFPLRKHSQRSLSRLHINTVDYFYYIINSERYSRGEGLHDTRFLNECLYNFALSRCAYPFDFFLNNCLRAAAKERRRKKGKESW